MSLFILVRESCTYEKLPWHGTVQVPPLKK